MRLGHSYCSSRVVDTISTPPSYLESKQAIEILKMPCFLKWWLPWQQRVDECHRGDFLTDSDKLTYGLEAKNQNEYFDLNIFVWGMNNFGKAKK